ncbi:MAG: hypothetical protein A2206_01815 [Candidatus Magasanikbacteria bacterium RIFOXYA1_FULL_40_8]|uniref:Pseudouridine synthase RsuA/RluA-like domain-containing protein n=1 Tax=Candidatus Magasanikbacteria bacterium RIFOXYA1_FULL_40_8 TaxID=1798694 RepID=A0A1F6NU28_9BACT|nr:MAG: hypothetical protein A2206_01815 [Candidatus Magasanikbacteria bacterium RIFOXYA1_FULL_40_8]
METKPQKNPKIYIALNKPVDYSVSTDGEQNLLVSDLIIKENYAGNYNKDLNAKNYFINAPDKDSEGLAILTNDQGASAWFARLYCEYELTIGRPLIRDAKKVLEAGMNIDGEFFPGIKIKREFNKGKRTIITINLKGKETRIRRMFGRLGYNISIIRRTKIGKLKLGTLPVGKWQLAKKEEVV